MERPSGPLGDGLAGCGAGPAPGAYNIGVFLLFLKYIPLSVTALLPVVNPVGSALLYLSLTASAEPRLRRQMALKIALNGTIFLAVVEFTGAEVLRFFGLSLPVVQIAGGIVVATIGWTLLNQPAPSPGESAPLPPELLRQRQFYPLTFPLTIGPGCIVVMLTLSAHASRARLSAAIAAHLGLLAGVLLLGASVYLAYAHADALLRRISPQFAHGIMRIIDFLLVCIGVQIVWNGVHALMRAH